MSKILIVEDDAILSKAIHIALEQAGFEVETAMDGEIAIQKMRKEPFDLVLLDLLLPKKLGEDVLTEMKEDASLKHIPVFIATVKSDSDSVKHCMALGAEGYFIKAHYSLDEIVQRIKEVLAKKAS